MKKKRRNYSRTIDLLFLLVLLISIIYSFYTLFAMNLLPTLWLVLALIVTVMIYILLFYSITKRWAKWFVYAKTCFYLPTYAPHL